jgi:glycosyltransferase involved in cell wall biosynthesis
MVNSTIVIPAHELNTKLEKSINSILSQIEDEDEIILISNNNKELAIHINDEYPIINVFLTDYKHFGAGLCRNIGAKFAQCEQLIFIDSDVVLPTGGIQTFKENYQPECILMPTIECWDENDNLLEKDKRFYAYIDSVKGFILSGNHQVSNMVWGTCFSMSKKVYWDLGGIDTQFYGLPCEEGDLAKRFETKYNNFMFIPTIVKHLGIFSDWTPEGKHNRDLINDRIGNNFYLENPTVNGGPKFFEGKYWNRFIFTT